MIKDLFCFFLLNRMCARQKQTFLFWVYYEFNYNYACLRNYINAYIFCINQLFYQINASFGTVRKTCISLLTLYFFFFWCARIQIHLVIIVTQKTILKKKEHPPLCFAIFAKVPLHLARSSRRQYDIYNRTLQFLHFKSV